MDTQLQFKPASLSDLPLLHRFMLDFYEHEQITERLPSAKKALTTLLQRSDLGRVWLIARGKGRDSAPAIGYAVVTYSYSLEYGGTNALLDEFYVMPDQRGTGVGNETLRFLAEELTKNGVQVMYLEVDRDNESAHRLYRKHSFTDQNRFLLTKRLGSSNS